jgi:hypothetical protein
MRHQGLWAFVVFLFFFSVFVSHLLGEKLTSMSSSSSVFAVQFLSGIVFLLDISLIIVIVGNIWDDQNQVITTSPEPESTVLIIS